DGQHTGRASLPGGVVQSEGRYSWAYLLRRPRSTDRSVVDLTVVVYSGRSLYRGSGESAYGDVGFDPSTNIVSVPYAGDKPAIRVGGWILDASLAIQEVPPGSGNFVPQPHGFFYRVVNITEKPNQLDLELQTNPRLSTINSTTGKPYGVLVVLENVVE